jgi:cytochrome c biogenesis protein CcmG/thiol:disulfide interchange protein DsbE
MRWVVIGIAAALVGLLAYGVASQDSDPSAGALATGKPAPGADESLPQLGATSKGSIDDYRGKVVLVNFWASWCGPCTAELPLLQKAQSALERNGATVLGINSRDNTEDAMKWVDDKHLTYPSLHDGSGDFADEWGVHQIPETYLLDEDGKVIALMKGPLTQRWIDEHVTPLTR